MSKARSEHDATVLEPVLLPWSGTSLLIERPVDTDALLDAAAGDPEQNLPYWAEIWPSGVALADLIETEPARFAGRRALELGCGLGVTAAAALRAGVDLLVTDYFASSLHTTERNCVRNANRAPRALQVNWRQPNAASAFAREMENRFPLVLAADVLYERRDIEPLLALVDRLVAPTGELWLAEPGRAPAALWLERARESGWRVESRQHPGPWPDPKDDGVVVGLHHLTRQLAG